jgi:hypothetical protein
MNEKGFHDAYLGGFPAACFPNNNEHWRFADGFEQPFLGRPHGKSSALRFQALTLSRHALLYRGGTPYGMGLLFFPAHTVNHSRGATNK